MGLHVTYGAIRPKREANIPINRLPLELLHQTILVTIEEIGGPPLVLIHVTVSGFWGFRLSGYRAPDRLGFLGS